MTHPVRNPGSEEEFAKACRDAHTVSDLLARSGLASIFHTLTQMRRLVLAAPGCCTFLGSLVRALQAHGCSAGSTGSRLHQHDLYQSEHQAASILASQPGSSAAAAPLPSFCMFTAAALLLPSSQLSHLSSQVQVEAEEVSDVSEQFNVSVVPSFAILKVCEPTAARICLEGHHCAVEMQHFCSWGQLRTGVLHQAGSQCKSVQRPKSSHALGQWPSIEEERGSHFCTLHVLARPALEPSCALQDGKTVEQIEGADAAALSEAISKHCSTSGVQGPINPASGQAASPAQAAPPANGPQQNGAQQERAAAVEQDITRRIKQLLASSPILLFMKVCSACLISALVFPQACFPGWGKQVGTQRWLVHFRTSCVGWCWTARQFRNRTSPNTTVSLCGLKLVSSPMSRPRQQQIVSADTTCTCTCTGWPLRPQWAIVAYSHAWHCGVSVQQCLILSLFVPVSRAAPICRAAASAKPWCLCSDQQGFPSRALTF